MQAFGITVMNLQSTTTTPAGKGVGGKGASGAKAGRTAGASKNNQYVIMIERTDPPSSGTSPKPTRHYLRGPITGPVMPGGGVDDFDLQVFTMAANQFFEVDPSAS